jgi:hypothetical protein
VLPSIVVGAVLAVTCLMYVARSMRAAAAR